MPPSLILCLYILMPVLFGMGAYIMKTVISRIEVLEQKIETKITESDARQILADNISPIKEDLTEIKESVKKLFELYLQDRHQS